VEIRTTISRANRRLVTFDYEMRSVATGTSLATGFTSHIFLNRAMRPTTLPAQFRRLFGIAETTSR
jgi:acyl-CoA thioesterase FadM